MLVSASLDWGNVKAREKVALLCVCACADVCEFECKKKQKETRSQSLRGVSPYVFLCALIRLAKVARAFSLEVSR